jgi:hypothetical protein
MPLLLPSFKSSDAWQYSISNLLRLAQQGHRGGLEPSKPRFKPVAKPEALLRQPKVSVRQLRGDVRTALQVGATQQLLQVTIICDSRSHWAASHMQQHYVSAISCLPCTWLAVLVAANADI